MLISARDARLLAKDMTLDPGEEEGKLRGGYSGAETEPTRTIAPGDRSARSRSIAAPGHTPGQMAFLDTRDRTLYCADAYATIGGVATTAKRYWRFPLPASATWHHPTALETAKALRELGPARLAPGPRQGGRGAGRRDAKAIARGSA